MTAPKKNQYWKARKSHGRKRRFPTPEQFWQECEQYLMWVTDHPLPKSERAIYAGRSLQYKVPKVKTRTLSGLCLFLGIRYETFLNYRKREGFKGVTEQVEKILYNKKFAGARAECLNPKIRGHELISRSEKNG